MRQPAVWQPKYAITPATASHLMAIEAARAVVAQTPLPPDVEAELRRRARLRSTHFSTRIEGNRLTLAEAQEAIEHPSAAVAGRERDVAEVRCYWNALLRVEEWAEKRVPLTEDLLRRLHALVHRGSRAAPTPYRDGQNVIRDSATGAIVYLPPEARDVPALMAELVGWISRSERDALPTPIIAALAHYQFVTIHPYYDGNGRTARLLATLILHRGGYGLGGFFSLEEHHARALPGYYQALIAHPHHNYYEGRADAELTSWLEHFTHTLARVFTEAKDAALHLAGSGRTAEPPELRRLDTRARIVLGLFAQADRIAAPDVAKALGLSDRMARLLLRQWVDDGWLVIADPSRRGRAYALSAVYRQFVGNSSAMAGG